MSELDNAYKKAWIKYVNVELPALRKAMEEQKRSMDNLARQIHLMPTSMRMRY